MVTAHAARRAIGNAIRGRLDALTGPPALTVYLGEIVGSPPVIETAEGPDASGRVAPYAVVWPGGGRVDANPSLALVPADFIWTGQITFAAGFVEDLLHTVDRATPHLHLWTPSIDGLACGPLRFQRGVDIGPPRRDDNRQPPRFYLPTFWQLHVVTSIP